MFLSYQGLQKIHETPKSLESEYWANFQSSSSSSSSLLNHFARPRPLKLTLFCYFLEFKNCSTATRSPQKKFWRFTSQHILKVSKWKCGNYHFGDQLFVEKFCQLRSETFLGNFSSKILKIKLAKGCLNFKSDPVITKCLTEIKLSAIKFLSLYQNS